MAIELAAARVRLLPPWAMVARVEAQIAIDTLIRRLPNLGLRTDAPAWRENLVLRGLTALPLRCR